MLEGLVALKRSLEEQRRHVAIIIGLLGGETTNGEEQMIENLKEELDIEKQKNLKLEMEMEFLKIAISGASAAASFPK
ncbi:hypothetical protein OIU79_004127 [Salix purpurea]|uniref:Uncharacterized protein n=1 Tax=Salix purpurea TaxID=77065 RepID=A0A9Q0U9F1_SALPP|nr:hypothetical protein OIU79_004127 [Salix purpurea]